MRPINSQKHEGTWSNLGQNASTSQSIVVIKAQERGTIGTATPEEVAIGSKVNSVYFEFNLNGVDNSGAAAVFHWIIFKNPNNTIGTTPDPLLYNQDIKSKILKRGMEMLPEIPLGSGGTVQIKRIFVVRIPRGLSRFAQNDRLQLVYRSTSASGVNFCGITIFKEYT